MLKALFIIWAIACIGFTALEIRDRIRARRFHARCQARLVALVERDTFDGEPI